MVMMNLDIVNHVTVLVPLVLILLVVYLAHPDITY
jgi:hypothetical protein